MNIPAFIAIPIRAVFLIGFIIFVAVGTIFLAITGAGAWFYRTVTET